MATTILCSEISKTQTYPIFININAPYSCGTVSVICSDLYTEQMVHEMPNVNIDIYTSISGNNIKYKCRSLVCPINKDLAQSFIISDIPDGCSLCITPLFDETAITYHNNIVSCEGIGEYWQIPTTLFPVQLIWNNDNVMAIRK